MSKAKMNRPWVLLHFLGQSLGLIRGVDMETPAVKTALEGPPLPITSSPPFPNLAQVPDGYRTVNVRDDYRVGWEWGEG